MQKISLFYLIIHQMKLPMAVNAFAIAALAILSLTVWLERSAIRKGSIITHFSPIRHR